MPLHCVALFVSMASVEASSLSSIKTSSIPDLTAPPRSLGTHHACLLSLFSSAADELSREKHFVLPYAKYPEVPVGLLRILGHSIRHILPKFDIVLAVSLR